MNSPVGLGVSPTTTTPTDFFSKRFWGFISPCTGTLCYMVSLDPQLFLPVCLHMNVGPATPPATALLATVLLPLPCLKSSLPGCSSLALLQVWMNVFSLTLWLSDFQTVRFSGNSGCFLFLNLLLSLFCLCKKAQCVYLCIHLGQKSKSAFITSWWRKKKAELGSQVGLLSLGVQAEADDCCITVHSGVTWKIAVGEFSQWVEFGPRVYSTNLLK